MCISTLVRISQLEQEHSGIEMKAKETEKNRICDVLLHGMTVGEVTPPTTLNKGELIAFRGYEGYCFNAF